MRLSKPLLAVVAGLSTALSAAGLVVVGAPAAHAATLIPSHVFAPYFEAYQSDSPATLSQQSGAKFLTMAFLQTASAGSCTVDWNGSTSTPVSSATYGSDIATIRANGGDVIPSFGGYTADHNGTEIADSCTDVSQIAAAYESVITTYNVTRLDLDTEDNSLTNTAGIDRRNKAIKMVDDWAAANGRTVQFEYTLPSTTSGLADTGLAVLQNAVTNGARVDIANVMTFDYYDGATHEMATDSENAAAGLEGQLAGLYPNDTTSQLWGMIGVTEMVGIDDYGAAETFTTADGPTVESWAVSKGIASLSFWALQRDNGGCVGTAGSDTCSGIAQSTWQFSNDFEPFTSGGTQTNDFSVALSPTSGSVSPGGSTTSTVTTAVTAGSAQSVSLSVSGAPAGVTASVSPTSVTAGGTATLSVSTTSSVAAGSYPLTVTGTAASGSHTATYTLTVKAANDFSLSVSPSSGAVNQGASTTATVSTAVTSGSAQSVSLSTSGVPAGVTATLSPTSVTAGGTAKLTLAASANAAAGSYPITITGKGTGATHTATYTLTVNGSTSGGLTNGGFESGALAPWTCQSGDAVVTSPVHSGKYAAQIAATDSQTGECDQTITVTPNASHTLTAWVQGSYAFVGVTGGASASTWASGSGWTQVTVPFTTGSSGTITVFVHGWYGQGTIYADDIAVS